MNKKLIVPASSLFSSFLLVSLGGAIGVSAQEHSSFEAWRTHLISQTADDSIWLTSNAKYVNEDGGIDSYGMRFEMLPGGVAARGCLWGIRDGGALPPSWEFFTAWDPTEEKAIFYQVSPSGMFGFGYGWFDADGVEVAEQTFRGTDGAEFRLRHETRLVDNSREGQSFEWVDGNWVPRRVYVWVRSAINDPPC